MAVSLGYVALVTVIKTKKSQEQKRRRKIIAFATFFDIQQNFGQKTLNERKTVLPALIRIHKFTSCLKILEPYIWDFSHIKLLKFLFNSVTTGSTWKHNWVFFQHCGCWCPGANAPGHQQPQCWLSACFALSVSWKTISWSEHTFVIKMTQSPKS